MLKRTNALDSSKMIGSPRPYVEPLEVRKLLSAAIFPSEMIRIGENPGSIGVGDLTGDGVPDIVASLRVPGFTDQFSVRINPGKPGGGFDLPIEFSQTKFRDLEVADINGDGRPDIVGRETGTSMMPIAVFLNQGNGVFATEQTFATSAQSDGMLIGDIDNDGRDDVILRKSIFSASNTIQIFWGNADGTLSTPLNYQVNSEALMIGDFNDDGFTDLLDEYETTRIHVGQGARTFASILTIPMPGGVPTGAGDINGDGRIDLVNSNGVSYGIVGGWFAPNQAVSFPAAWSPTTKVLGVEDYDGDGRGDVVGYETRMNTDGVVSIIVGSIDTANVFTTKNFAYVGFSSSVQSRIMADLDGDGFRDVIVAKTNRGIGSVHVLRGGDPDFFLADAGAPGVANFGSPGRAITHGRFIEGSPDVLAVLSGSGILFRPTINGSSLPVSAGYTITAPGWSSFLDNSDFNNDGRLDFVFGLSGNQFGVAIATSSTTMQPAVPYALPFAGYDCIVRDLNNDGFEDLLVYSSVGSFKLFFANGTSGFVAGPQYSLGLTSTFAVAEDFNGDSRVDVICTSGNQIAILLQDPTGAFAAPSLITVNSNGRSLLVKDLNGDGRADISVTMNHTGLGNAVPWTGAANLYYQNVNGSLSDPLVVPLGTYRADSLAAYDFDDDGKLDLVASDSQISIVVARGLATGGYESPRHHSTVVAAIPPGDRLKIGFSNNDNLPDLVGYGLNPSFFPNQGFRTAPSPVLDSASLDIDTRTVTFDFDLPMTNIGLSASDLVIRHLPSGIAFGATAARLSGSHSLVFSLPTNLPDGDYEFRISAGSVMGVSGQMNAAEIVLSGAGVFVLAGDVNRDRSVNFTDLLILSQNYGQSGKVFTQGNVDYSVDGLVGFSDLLILAQRYGSGLFTSAVGRSTADKKSRVSDAILA